MTKRNQAPDDRHVQDLRPRPVRLTSDMSLPKLSAVEIGSYIVALIGMWAVLHLQLLGALLAGMLVYQLVHTMAPLIEKRVSGPWARWISVVLLSAAIVGALTGVTIGIIEHFETFRSMPDLFERGRRLALHSSYQFVEIYKDCLRVVSLDGSVSVIEE